MLVRPQPLPDELDRSYLGALMRCNGAADEQAALRLIAAWDGSAEVPRRSNPVMKLLSVAADIDFPAFARSHSMLALRRGITGDTIEYGSEAKLELIYNFGIGLVRPGAYLCHDCAWEDFDFHGRSYWRREHQTPGLFWCPKHRRALSVVKDETALLLPPTQVLDRAEILDAGWTDRLQQHPLIARFLELCGVLMDSPRPYFIICVREALRVAALSQGLTCNPVKQGQFCDQPLLSDAILDAYPIDWLVEILPALGGKPRGVASHLVDDVLWAAQSAAAGFAYILALALLFNSIDEAQIAIRDAPRDPVFERRLKARVIARQLAADSNHPAPLKTQHRAASGTSTRAPLS